jgi:hypothetical protein
MSSGSIIMSAKSDAGLQIVGRSFNILNPPRMSNCTVQASVFNGDTLAKSFNIQSMRIIRGRCSLIGNSSGGDNVVSTILDQYTRAPINISSADVIVSVVVENGSGPLNGLGVFPATNIPPEFFNGLQPLFSLYFGSRPVYNPNILSWFPGQISKPITYNFTNGDVNLGKVLTTVNNSPDASDNWIYLNTNYPYLYTGYDAALNVSLLVMTPQSAG